MKPLWSAYVHSALALGAACLVVYLLDRPLATHGLLAAAVAGFVLVALFVLRDSDESH